MFGCIVAGRLVQATPQMVSENKYMFLLENGSSINHLVVFLTGQTPLPQGYGAGIYFGWPPYSDWKFLGFISNEKPSVVFKVGQSSPSVHVNHGLVEVEMASAEPNVTVQLGISLELLSTLEAQVQQKKVAAGVNSGALVVANSGIGGGSGLSMADMAKFATKTLQNLRDYALSFAVKPAGANVEAIPTDTFTKWYNSYAAKCQKDPDFWRKDVQA
eukprot:TRINITY_DN2895_c0_g1_i1.p1 TRINITY_DN2895_c0_g1~~TRINITY_DN2895_c0_g1_i1.p1  ORF type:complete len:216 (+),score=64.56 TRINITY_DN2895_c0_g1_i1:118-765(+)